MKKLINIAFFLLVLGFVSCTDEDNELTGNENLGGLLQNVTPAVTYANGSDADDLLEASISTFQGREKVQSVEVYNQYFGVVGGVSKKSNKVLLKTLSFPVAQQFESIDFNFSFNDLRQGLTYNGSTFPTDDSTLEIGDYWQLTYVAKLTDGSTIHASRLDTKVKVACGSFLEGEYVITYASGPQPITITSLGGGLYRASYFPTFTAVYWWEFSDTCGILTITDWQFQGGNPIFGTSTPNAMGVVNPDGSLTFSGVNVTGVAFYVDRSWTIFPN